MLSPQGFAYGRGKRPSSTSQKLRINLLQFTDKIAHFSASIGPSRCFTKMGATGERAIFVDEAAGSMGIQERAGSVGAFWQISPPGGSQRFCRNQCLTFGDLRYQASQFELAAFRP